MEPREEEENCPSEGLHPWDSAQPGLPDPLLEGQDAARILSLPGGVTVSLWAAQFGFQPHLPSPEPAAKGQAGRASMLSALFLPAGFCGDCVFSKPSS